ncbi:MAG: tetratricopeptide repeat protein [Planctomycetes bacterium]|nr:tetratricopeptide repeat protein [Planctomycetota bacterium]
MAIDVTKQVQKAELAASQKKYELAIEIYLQALAIDPDNRAGRRGVRLAAVKQMEISPTSGLSQKMQLAAVKAKLLNPNLDTRIAAYETYLKIDPKNISMAHELAATCEKAKYLNAAIGVHEASAEIAPKDTHCRVALGRLLAGRESQKALEHLEKALAIDPKCQEAIKIRKDLAAELSIKKAGFETARTTHDLLRDKERTKELSQADRIQRDDAQAGDVVTRLQGRMASTPDDKKSLRELARALASGGRVDEAQAAWRKLIELDPTDFDAKVQVGDIRIAQSERKIAAAEATKNTALAAELRRAHTLIVIEEYQTRVAEHPTDLALRFALGEALLEAKRLDDAIAEFQKAVKDPRKRVDGLCVLGECFIEKGLFDLAARQLEKALEESPGLNSERGKAIVYNLGRLRERQGQFATARDEFLKVYEVDVGYRDVADKVTEMSLKAK